MKSILARLALPALTLALAAPAFAQQGAPGGSLKHPEINASQRPPRHERNGQQPAPAAGKDARAATNYNGATQIPSNGTTGTSR